MPPSDTRTNLRPSDSAIERASDVLPTPGRPDEAENRTLDRRIELADGEVFDDAILRLLEPGVIGVEDALGLQQIDDFLGPLAPRQRDQPVDVGARHGVLGRGHRHLRQTIELAQRFFLDRLGHAGRLDLLGELFDFLGLVVAFAEFLLDRLHLLAQEVLALVLADLRLHLRLNLRSELEDLELLDQDAIQVVQPRADVERLEHFLLDGGADGREARGDEVREPARVRRCSSPASGDRRTAAATATPPAGSSS